ncbi:26512_t:CDS:2, partial [Racocetra persica]
MKQVKPSCASYSIEQKNRVINSASWGTEISQGSRRIGSGRKAFYSEAEEKLYTWLMEQRKQGLAVTYTMLQVKMLELLEKPEITNPYNLSKDFKTSDHWLSAFLKRYKLSWRWRTKIFQKLPEQTQESLNKFYNLVTKLKNKKSYELCNILNMNETLVWFNMAGNFTVDQQRKKMIHIHSTGNENNRFTIVLTCAA